MALHNCPYSFEQMAVEVLPGLYRQLLSNLHHAQLLGTLLSAPTVLPSASACYVIKNDECAIYVGITKNLRRRVMDHVADDPSRANLALRIAAKNLAMPLNKAKLAENFPTAFINARQYLKECCLGWIEVPDAMSLYLIEPYAAMQLDTHEYNKFDTLQILSPRRVVPMSSAKRLSNTMPIFNGKSGLTSGLSGLSTGEMLDAADA